LHLISDILSNSACPLPNAVRHDSLSIVRSLAKLTAPQLPSRRQWKYRDVFEARLVPVFDHLGELYQSFKAQAGRLSAETFRGQVAGVLDVLDLWCVPSGALGRLLSH
jgi:U2-associated protein SR140